MTFGETYRASVSDVMAHLGDDVLRAMARHNPACAPGRLDMRGYLLASEVRYEHALDAFTRSGGRLDGLASLDVAGLAGAFPLALARCGVQATMTEAFAYYDGALDGLRAYLEQEGVEVWDADATVAGALPEGRRFGLVTMMALLEHLAHSPRAVMANATGALAGDGRLIVEVPNLAYWPWRLRVLAGGSIHAPLRDVYEAQEPFTGHHREYTEADLRELVTLSGLHLRRFESFNYTPQDFEPNGLRGLIDWPRRHVAGAREVLLVCAARTRGELGAFDEDVYGSRARLDWLRSRLTIGDRVVEVGCATGAQITLPLTEAGHDVTGIDRDDSSIDTGRALAASAGLDPQVLRAVALEALDGPIDVVILSEALEHYADDGVRALLAAVHERLRPGGRLLLTVPNGYGACALERLLWSRAGIGRAVRALRIDVLTRLVEQLLRGRRRVAPRAADVAAARRQRFTARRLRRALREAGFEIDELRGSVLLCGPISDMLLGGGRRWLRRNVALGRRAGPLAAGFYVAARRT